MKFELDRAAQSEIVRAYTDSEFLVGKNRITRPVVLYGAHIDSGLLPATIHELSAEHIQRLCALGADMVVIGTGTKQIFLDSSLTSLMLERGIGCEMMDTAAACRIYNVLVSESRSVAAALFMWNDSGTVARL